MNLLQTIGADLAADLEALKNSTSNEVRQLAGLIEHAFQNAAATPPPATDAPASDTATPPTSGDAPMSNTFLATPLVTNTATSDTPPAV